MPEEQRTNSGRHSRDEKINLLAAYQLQTRYVTKTTITIVAVIVVLGGAVLAYALGKHRVFMPGPVSTKHTLFAEQCFRCHTPWKPIMTVVPNDMCLHCHSVSPHFKDRSVIPNPQCATCHVEHKGKPILSVMGDSACIQCHANLKVKDGPLRFEAKVLSFTSSHPEFAVSVLFPGQKTPERVRLNEKERLADTASIKLNHNLHLQSDLLGPDGPEQLTCASCHQPDSKGAYMRPINYEKDCMRCHLLNFDERFPGKTAPHGQQLNEIDHFLRATYAEFYLRKHGSQLRDRGLAQRLADALQSKEENSIEEIDKSVAKAERLLLGEPDRKTIKGKCLLCHVLEPPDQKSVSGARLPRMVKTAIPERWLPYSVFNHLTHNTLKCLACHEAAATSKVSGDVLLPGVASCRACHFEPRGARAKCVECHVHHDKSQVRKPGDQPYSIEQFKKGQASPLSNVPATSFPH